MNDIISCTLQDICLPEKGSIISGPFGSNISSKFFVEKGIPVIRGNNLTLDSKKFIDDGFVFITEEKANELKCDAYCDDLIFTAAGTIGQVGVIPKDAKYSRYVISNKQIRVRLNLEIVDLDYVYCWFSSPWMQSMIRNLNKGSTVPLLTLAEIKSLPVVFPREIRKQKSIGRLLNNLDTIIGNNISICSDLEAMAKLLYDYWFVQFDFPDENGKPYKSSGGKMVWNEQLKREIPEGWEKKEVSVIANIVAISVTPHPDIEYRHYSIPAFDEKGMPVEESGASINSNKYLVPENAILVSKLNPQFKRIWVISDSDDRSICSTEFIPFVSIEDHREYLYSLLNSDAFHTYMVQCSSSSTGSRTRMDPELCLRFAFAFPKDNALIERYCKTIAPMLSKIEELKDENQQLTSLRDFLLPMLMNGQVKVSTERRNG